MSYQTQNLSQSSSVPGASRQSLVPEVVRDLMSKVSSADECFINQRFSGKLQAFLISYVAVTTSDYGISATTISH